MLFGEYVRVVSLAFKGQIEGWLDWRDGTDVKSSLLFWWRYFVLAGVLRFEPRAAYELGKRSALYSLLAREQAALAEDPRTIPSTHTNSQGSIAPYCPS